MHKNKYGVNALVMFGIACNETAYGTSNIAKTKNNLFGLNAVDSSPGQSANYLQVLSNVSMNSRMNGCLRIFRFI